MVTKGVTKICNYIIVVVLISVLMTVCKKLEPMPELHDRLQGILMASAIADAMAGPHEGRSTEESQTFLEKGGWINNFNDYTVWHQHHWNVYQRLAPAGTITDDDRMRLDMVNFMLDYREAHIDPMPREALAHYVIQRYLTTRQAFIRIDKKYQASRRPNSTLEQMRKEHFLAMWFAWEIFKTATSVVIPEPQVWSPPYQRVSDDPRYGEYSPAWHLQPVEPLPVTEEIKSSFHFNSYAKGHVMPLGLIHLLPVASYFPGSPRTAYRYVLSIDFFDIGEAPHFVGVACAIIADLLGNRKWSEISAVLRESTLAAYLGMEENDILSDMDAGLKTAIQTAQQFIQQSTVNRRELAREFISTLHHLYAVDEPIMCTVQEMLYGSVALLEFVNSDLPWLIEVGINYGRDNDTIASIAATFGGAAAGVQALPRQWRNIVQTANPQYNFAELASRLAEAGVDTHKR